MAQMTVPQTTAAEVLEELAALDDPKVRAVNARHGDDHGVNLSQLRALAKRLRTQHALAQELWRSGETPARLVAILICKPKEFAAADKGFTAVKHQREVGTGYFDSVTTAIEANASTGALKGSTEDEQFFEKAA